MRPLLQRLRRLLSPPARSMTLEQALADVETLRTHAERAASLPLVPVGPPIYHRRIGLEALVQEISKNPLPRRIERITATDWSMIPLTQIGWSGRRWGMRLGPTTIQVYHRSLDLNIEIAVPRDLRPATIRLAGYIAEDAGRRARRATTVTCHALASGLRHPFVRLAAAMDELASNDEGAIGLKASVDAATTVAAVVGTLRPDVPLRVEAIPGERRFVAVTYTGSDVFGVETPIDAPEAMRARLTGRSTTTVEHGQFGTTDTFTFRCDRVTSGDVPRDPIALARLVREHGDDGRIAAYGAAVDAAVATTRKRP